MLSGDLLTLLSILFYGISEIFINWIGNILWDHLGIQASSPLRVLPGILIGALIAGYLGESARKQAKKQPDNIALISANNQMLISTSAVLSLIPLLFSWCGDKTFVEQSVMLFISLAPFAAGIKQATRISHTIEQLYIISHDFLEELSKSSSRIKSRWLYMYLKEHPAAQEFDAQTLQRFSIHKIKIWAKERGDVNIYETENDIVAEVLSDL